MIGGVIRAVIRKNAVHEDDPPEDLSLAMLYSFPTN